MKTIVHTCIHLTSTHIPMMILISAAWSISRARARSHRQRLKVIIWLSSSVRLYDITTGLTRLLYYALAVCRTWATGDTGTPITYPHSYHTCASHIGRTPSKDLYNKHIRRAERRDVARSSLLFCRVHLKAHVCLVQRLCKQIEKEHMNRIHIPAVYVPKLCAHWIYNYYTTIPMVMCAMTRRCVCKKDAFYFDLSFLGVRWESCGKRPMILAIRKVSSEHFTNARPLAA